MTDQELFTALISVLGVGLSARGLTGVTILQARQPTTQGVAPAPALYLSHVTTSPIGQVESSDVWDELGQEQRQTQVHRLQTTIQVQAWAPFDTSNPAAVRPMDLIRRAREAVRGPDGLERWKEFGAQILNPSAIRNTAAIDDREQWQDNPSFDVPILHSDIFIRVIPATETITASIHRV